MLSLPRLQEPENGDQDPVTEADAAATVLPPLDEQRIEVDTEMTRSMVALGVVPIVRTQLAEATNIDQKAIEQANREYLNRSKAKFSLLRAGDTADECEVFNSRSTNGGFKRVGVTTVVELLLVAATDVSANSDSKDSKVANSERPTIRAASREWNLNTEQHVAFTLMCCSILREVAKRIQTCTAPNQLPAAAAAELANALARIKVVLDTGRNSVTDSTQLVMGLFGKGGTGKSRVIQAAVDFAKRWYVADAVVITATSGIAGVLINGFTYHRALGINPHDSNKQKLPDITKKKNGGDYVAAWASVALLVVDEISMAASSALTNISNQLQQLKKENTRDWGGIDVVLTGDWFQLPPIGCKVYLANGGKTEIHAKGFSLYRSMNAAVELLRSHRHSTDTKMEELCDRFRYNKPSRTDLELLNTRVVTSRLKPPEGTLLFVAVDVRFCHSYANCICNFLPGTVLAVPENAERLAINGLAFRTFCLKNPYSSQIGWKQRGCLRILAVVMESKSGSPVDEDTANRVRKLPEDGLNNRCGKLDLIIGGPLMLTHNAEVAAGLANGTMATLVDVILSHQATVVVVPLEDNTNGQTYVHRVTATDVVGLVLKHCNPDWALRDHFPSLPRGCFPLSIDRRFSGGRLISKDGVKVKITVHQFYCVPAFALTGHKTQGSTLPSILVGSWGRHRYGARGWMYVVLSRVRDLNSFFMLEPVTTNKDFFKERTEEISEMERLRTKLCQPTVQKALRLLDPSFNYVEPSAAETRARRRQVAVSLDELVYSERDEAEEVSGVTGDIVPRTPATAVANAARNNTTTAAIVTTAVAVVTNNATHAVNATVSRSTTLPTSTQSAICDAIVTPVNRIVRVINNVATTNITINTHATPSLPTNSTSVTLMYDDYDRIRTVLSASADKQQIVHVCKSSCPANCRYNHNNNQHVFNSHLDRKHSE